MVVSKDSKRKRKESPPTPVAVAVTAPVQPAAVESSPEMPKRTKVQAQRKFAQGQSAPASSSAYNAANPASCSSNTGPSTSSESREPPTEILPNKRPKTEDFLTFLCFRGTSALPPHLDFLNQGTKTKEAEQAAVTARKNVVKAAAAAAAAAAKQSTRKGKKGGRSKGNAKCSAATTKAASASTSAAAAAGKTASAAAALVAANAAAASSPANEVEKRPATTAASESENGGNQPTVSAGGVVIPSFAVRKRAEVVADGNRRQLRHANEADKCNSPVEAKRRSNRANAKDAAKLFADGGDSADDDEEPAVAEDEDEDEDEEYFSATEDAAAAKAEEHPTAMAQGERSSSEVAGKGLKRSSTPAERKSETASNHSEAGRGRRGKAATTTKKDNTNDAGNNPKDAFKPINDVAAAKEKPAAVKRIRKESPIFIPSPESSGRMTRQRAFFEPVKVPHREEGEPGEAQEANNPKAEEKPPPGSSNATKRETAVLPAAAEASAKAHTTTTTTADTLNHSHEDDKSKNCLNVFDFSSDDEQPLAQSIKQKRGAAKAGGKPNRKQQARRRVSPKKSTVEGNVQGPKKTQSETSPVAATGERALAAEKHITASDETTKDGQDESTPADRMPIPVEKAKNKRGRGAKKRADHTHDDGEKVEGLDEVELAPPSPKKAANARQGRRKGKANEATINGGDDELEETSSPTPPVRSQRPPRKTKEAATIYMGIIGHKLQLADDEDDDISLNSFPDRPNVKEMEKMEYELKKNAGQVAPPTAKLSTAASAPAAASKAAAKPAQSAVPTSTTTLTTTTPPVEKPPTSGRRGRPPKVKPSAAGAAAIQAPPQPPPPKREIEGMLVKKGALAKMTASPAVDASPASLNNSNQAQRLSEHGKMGAANTKAGDSEEDEDFLLNEELNTAKRKLEKSFSDSDDEPLAIKLKDKEGEQDSRQSPDFPSPSFTAIPTTTFSMLPLTAKPITTPPLTAPAQSSNNVSPITAAAAHMQQQQQHTTTTTPPQVASPFKSVEKKSPVPTSKILNVPATYGAPSTPGLPVGGLGGGPSFGGKTPSYLPPASPHYHTAPAGGVAAAAANVRPPPPPAHQFTPVKSSPSASVSAVTNQSHLNAATVGGSMTPQQSPLKYQTPPTTYPPPIEAYPSPKINPNFLTPKFDRTSLPRSNNFPSPSPVKFDLVSSATGNITVNAASNKSALNMLNSTPNSKVLTPSILGTPSALPAGGTPTSLAASTSGAVGSLLSTTTAAAAAVTGAAASTAAAVTVQMAVAAAAAAAAAAGGGANNSSDPLKDEIGAILAANLMPSKEESGKIFGIASVSLAQSSGPDNTKCTLGKCGSIHKPVLGPVVPTEGYIGDQLSSKERRKAKVNMTHEQIQKWLIECSSNPDEIQDDLDDDIDDNLRPNLYENTPPPAGAVRDDKESTSFSSSSKATRDQGKSESAWSAKGPSLKATPVIVSSTRKDEVKNDRPTPPTAAENQMDVTAATSSPVDPQQQQQERGPQAMNLSQKASRTVNAAAALNNDAKSSAKEKSDKRSEAKRALREEKATPPPKKESASAASAKANTVAGKQSSTLAATTTTDPIQSLPPPSTATTTTNSVEPVPSKTGRKKNATAAAGSQTVAVGSNEKSPPSKASSSAGGGGAKSSNVTPTNAANNSNSAAAVGTPCSSKTPKRTPVYNQKTPKPVELKVTTTTSHKRTAPFSYGAFSADNERSVYSFDKDDDDGTAGGSKAAKSAAAAAAGYRRPSRQDSHNNDEAPAPPPPNSPKQQRLSGGKEVPPTTTPPQSSSVSLTLSPSENSKLVKVSLEAEKAAGKSTTAAAGKGKAASSAAAGTTPPSAAGKKVSSAVGDGVGNASAAAATGATEAADSESDAHTFYIPLQGGGSGGGTDGGIQGVAVKLGREGPDGPNQKVIMHATLVTKAQMGANSRPLPDSMNVSDIVKSLMPSAATTITTTTTATAATTGRVSSPDGGSHKSPSTSLAAAAGETAMAPASVSPNKSGVPVPVGHVQPRFKASEMAALAAAQLLLQTQSQPPQPSTSAGASGSGLQRANSNSSLVSSSARSRTGGGGGAITGPAPSLAGISTSAMAAAVAATAAANINKKFKDDTPIKMANNTAFPRHDDPTQMVEAPIFRPTEKEFADPIEFIERITPIAARFGICKIIPPSTFKPECRISDEMRFTAYNQYVHKMLHRWGPSAKELSAIKKYLATQSIVMNHPPWIGGMEVDLPRLYHTVQELGGLKEVIEKKKWARVAEEMCIPKLAQDRVTKLDDIYCKYLLPYDTLSPAERQKLFDEVEADWAKREARARRNADRFVNTESVSNEEDDVSSEDDEESEEEVDGVSMECIVKGRSMPLSQFYRIARNTMSLWFKNTEPTVTEVEVDFWRHVAVRDSHVCVHSGSIDSSGWGYGFPSAGPKGKGSNYARHPWNLKVLTNNPGSVLRSLGPVMGVTVPTLHVGMLFSACCWYRDPHGLSWIEYLHTGASKLWYGIPDDQSANFRAALTSLIPTHCQNKTIWLPCDTVMVPPHILTDRGVSLCRIEQKPGEFIVVFPRAYTSSLATGYVVSESVYFATSSWLELAKADFRDIHDSCEPAMFSLEQLLFALGYDQRVTPETKHQMLPMLQEVFEKETAAREQLKAAGVTSTEKVPNEKGAKAKKQQQPPYKCIESECDMCRANLYISMVKTDEANIYCLQHALKNLNNGNIQAKQCKLIYAYTIEDIENLLKSLRDRIQQRRNSASGGKKVK